MREIVWLNHGQQSDVVTHGEVAAGAELEADPGKGQAGPNAIVHRQKVAAGAEPKADPDEGRSEPNVIAHHDLKCTYQWEENPCH